MDGVGIGFLECNKILLYICATSKTLASSQGPGGSARVSMPTCIPSAAMCGLPLIQSSPRRCPVRYRYRQRFSVPQISVIEQPEGMMVI